MLDIYIKITGPRAAGKTHIADSIEEHLKRIVIPAQNLDVAIDETVGGKNSSVRRRKVRIAGNESVCSPQETVEGILTSNDDEEISSVAKEYVNVPHKSFRIVKLRDEIAIQAMASFMVAAGTGKYLLGEVADFSYKMADHMIEVRENGYDK